MKKLKGLLKSKTFWFNVVSGILAFVNATNGELISNETSGTIITVGNILLRMITTKPLEKK